MRKALVALAALLVLAPPAAHALFKNKGVSGNLDSDPALEQVKAVRVPGPADPSDDTLAQTAVDIVNDCPSGQTDQRISGTEEFLLTLRLVSADTRPGKEAFIDLRSGASGRHGELRLVGLRPAPAGSSVCAVPHNDFRYLSARPTRHPRGAPDLTDFELAIKNYSHRFKGSELRLLEGWAKPTDALCCPSFEKRSFYRYDRRGDRYVRYASRVTRTPRR